MPNALYYGDNLDVLRKEIRDESVDLIYLDPPFNSAATYNVLFKAPTGRGSQAQIEAFEDTWHWGPEAEGAFADMLQDARHPDAAEMLRALRGFLRENDMMAYLAMMAARLVELHRALKPTGSLYLHCDPTASHYLKLLLDAIFGADNFRNEIVWKRTTPKGLASTRFAANHDIIICHAKDRTSTRWNPSYRDYAQEQIDRKYGQKDESGRRFQLTSLLNPNPDRPNLTYEFRGVTRTWRWTKERMLAADAAGMVVVPRGGQGIPRFKRYLDEQEGVPVSDVWEDIPPINSQAQERLGYPTQKPIALLERIVRASTNEGDVVLDPFCGCGTTIHAAQKLGHRWIGVDVTHLAISLIERRLKDAFPGIAFDVYGTPEDMDGARDLARRDKYQFQWWAVSLLDAVPYGGKKKGADSGIDGWRYMVASRNDVSRAIISVKGGENVGVPMIRDLRGVIERERAEAGILVSLVPPTGPMEAEAAKAGFFDTPFGRFPRIQIMTVEQLLGGAKPKLPPLALEAAFRKAAREYDLEAKQGDLLAVDIPTMPRGGATVRSG